MLRKLIKHEFRATGRIMGPLFLIVVVLAVIANLSIRYLMDSETFLLSLLGGLLMFGFVIGMIGLAIMSIVLMVNRFRTNLMGDEGYVMFTLPVSSHQIVWSKIIVSSVWFIATTIVEFLAVIICMFDMEWLREMLSSRFFRELGWAIRQMVEEYGLNVPAIALEIVALTLVTCAVLCLEFYAAMAIGHSFANHKMAMSVLFFFVLQFAMQLSGGILISVIDETAPHHWMMNLEGMSAVHTMMLILIVGTMLTGAIYYIITERTLKKRLNLQ